MNNPHNLGQQGHVATGGGVIILKGCVGYPSKIEDDKEEELEIKEGYQRIPKLRSDAYVAYVVVYWCCCCQFWVD